MIKKQTNIIKLRHQIDVLDKELIFLLSQRIKIVKAIGIYKAKFNLKPLDKDRWLNVLSSRKALANKIGLRSNFISELFTIIHKYSLLTQEEVINV